MSEVTVTFDVPEQRTFTAWRSLPDEPTADGYAEAMAGLADAAARVAASEGRFVIGLGFEVQRRDGQGLRLVANGTAELARRSAYTFRAIGGQA